MHVNSGSVPGKVSNPCVPLPRWLASERPMQVPSTLQNSCYPVNLSHARSLINTKKSILTPVQKTELIGAVLDSVQAMAFLPQQRLQVMQLIALDLKTHPLITIQYCLRHLGHMVVCTYVVQHARMHFRELQRWLTSLYSPAHDRMDSRFRCLVESCPPRTGG